MSTQKCDFCQQLFKDGELVRAAIIAPYKALKSNRVYALGQPTDCLGMSHYPECYMDTSDEN